MCVCVCVCVCVCTCPLTYVNLGLCVCTKYNAWWEQAVGRAMTRSLSGKGPFTVSQVQTEKDCLKNSSANVFIFSCMQIPFMDTFWGCYGPGDLGSSDVFTAREAQVGIVVACPATSQGPLGLLTSCGPH